MGRAALGTESMRAVLAPGLLKRNPQTGRLNQQKIVFSQVWVLDVQDGGVSKWVSPETSLVGWQIAAFSLSPHNTFSVHSPQVFPPFLKKTPTLLIRTPPYDLDHHITS